MIRQPLAVVFLLVLVVGVDGFWWRKRVCLCRLHGRALLGKIEKLGQNPARRDVANFLDLEEDYPGLDNLLDHLDTKRDGSVDIEALGALLKRSGSMSVLSKRNHCKHCGRSLVDDFNQGLLH